MRTMKAKSAILKIMAVIALLFIGNRLYNHVTAWGGIGIIVLALLLAVYFVIKPINNNKKKE